MDVGLKSFGLAREPRVYFCLLRGEVQYVGKTLYLGARIYNHRQAEKFAFDAVVYLDVEEQNLTTTERHFLEHFQPPFNVRMPTRGSKDPRGMSAKMVHRALGDARHAVRSYPDIKPNRLNGTKYLRVIVARLLRAEIVRGLTSTQLDEAQKEAVHLLGVRQSHPSQRFIPVVDLQEL